jgi:hypothetical protein
MALLAALPGLQASPGVGYLAPIVIGGCLVGTAWLVAVRRFRRPEARLLTLASLFGGGAIAGQIVLVLRQPVSQPGFILGTLGATALYAVGVALLESRPNGLAPQWLVVGGAIWIAGTITVTNSLTAAQWPTLVSIGLGGGLPVGVQMGLRRDPLERALANLWPSLILGVAFLLPTVVHLAFGPEVLFVSYLVGVVVTVLCWSLYRVALSQQPDNP